LEKEMKTILKRMIENKGFVAQGVYSDDYHHWHSDTQKSVSTMNILVFYELRSKGYIRKDRTGRYYPTDLGRQFAAPWYKKIFDVI
jgi:hypothetical protein